MDTDLEGQTAVVIGGTTGIGLAISEQLHGAGATVVPTSRSESSVSEACRAVDCDLEVTTDVTNDADLNELFETVTDRHNGVNILVNSAGLIPNIKPVAEMTTEEWTTTIDVNLTGAFKASRAALDHIAGDNKAIVHVGSVASEMLLDDLAGYTASKMGLQGLVETLAVECGDDRIRVNVVAPGHVLTRQNEGTLENEKVKVALHEQIPFSRYTKPEEVADACHFLVSPASKFITGETIRIDGGFGLV